MQDPLAFYAAVLTEANFSKELPEYALLLEMEEQGIKLLPADEKRSDPILYRPEKNHLRKPLD